MDIPQHISVVMTLNKGKLKGGKKKVTSISDYSKEEMGQIDLQHAWVDWSVWAFVTPHVWSLSEWLIS